MAEPTDDALGRSRGGLTTKLHLGCEQGQKPLSIVLTAGHRGDSPQFKSTKRSGKRATAASAAPPNTSSATAPTSTPLSRTPTAPPWMSHPAPTPAATYSPPGYANKAHNPAKPATSRARRSNGPAR